jgi:hypothetical protein
MFDFNTLSVELANKYKGEYTFHLVSSLGLNPELRLSINKVKGGSTVLKVFENNTNEEILTQIEKLIK